MWAAQLGMCGTHYHTEEERVLGVHSSPLVYKGDKEWGYTLYLLLYRARGDKECWGYTLYLLYRGTKRVGGTLFISFTGGQRVLGVHSLSPLQGDKECWGYTLYLLLYRGLD